MISHICLKCILFVYWLTCHLANGQGNWTDCEPLEFSDPIYIHSFIISLPIRLPGTHNVTLDLVISKDVNEMLIYVEVGRENVTTRVKEKVYPLNDDALLVYDPCKTINKLLFGNPSKIEKDLDIQIDKLFVESIHYHAGCPMLQGRVAFRDRPIELPAMVDNLPSGSYIVKVTFRMPYKTQVKQVGCIEFRINYEQVING